MTDADAMAPAAAGSIAFTHSPALALRANNLLFMRIRQVIHERNFTPVDWIIAGIMGPVLYTRTQISFLTVSRSRSERYQTGSSRPRQVREAHGHAGSPRPR